MTRFYIIPKQTQSCLPSYKEESIYIDPDQFSITNSQDKSVVLEFPGCVDIKAQVSEFFKFQFNTINYLLQSNKVLQYYLLEWKLNYAVVFYFRVMYCINTIFYGTVMYCTILCCAVIYCTILYCTVKCCTVLYCTIFYSSPNYSNPKTHRKRFISLIV